MSENPEDPQSEEGTQPEAQASEPPAAVQPDGGAEPSQAESSEASTEPSTAPERSTETAEAPAPSASPATAGVGEGSGASQASDPSSDSIAQAEDSIRTPVPEAPEAPHAEAPGPEAPAPEAAAAEAPVPEAPEPHILGSVSESSGPVSKMPEGSIANPIKAMRVIKIEEHTKRSGSSPAIETSYEELDEEELGNLSPSPAPTSVEEIEPEVEEEVEEVVALEDVPKTPSAPAPPKRDSQPVIPAADRKPPPPRRSARPTLPKAKTPRKKPWWETLFGDDFSRAYRPMNQSQLSKEVDFMLEQLDVPRGAVILDLGCGQGEICVELARRGYSIVGYDLSVYQLAMAGDNAQQAKQKINFLQGDMREMAFDEMFDAVICWDTSFGYFEDEKNIDVLHRVKKALKPNGRFLLDVMNRDFAAREAPYNHWFEGDGCVCMDDMSLDWITNRLKVKRSIILDDGRSKELQYSTRLYTLSEVGRMLHDAGFRVSAVSGDVTTKGAFFGPASRRIIISAGKP